MIDDVTSVRDPLLLRARTTDQVWRGWEELGGAGRPKCQAGLGMGSWRRLRSAHLWTLNYCMASPTLTSVYVNIHISTSLHLLVESATFTIYEST